MASLLNIGLTGLNAAQAQLLTTGHNITNAAVEGYHRQTVVQTTQNPNYSGVGFFGQGTKIAAVTRSYNAYLENQVLTSSTRLAELTAYEGHIRQINNLLGDATSGLSPALEGFFQGVQEMAANPTSEAARQSLISTAEALVSRFQTLDARISEVREGVESEIISTVAQINMYAQAIAEMNQRITLAQVGGPTVAANDLLDQRDQLVAELNKLIRVETVEDDSGALNVFIGSGQGLVVGNTATQLAAVRDPNDPQRNVVALVSQSGVENILPESLLTGGSLGGLLSFRRETLDVAQNSLGLIAVGIAEAFNAQHRLGVDLDGVLGNDFFNSPTPVLKPAVTGATAAITDYSALTASDYLLTYDGTNYALRTTAGESIALTVDAGPPPSFSGGGVQITLPNGAADIPAHGLLIQPVRFAARDISVGISDPRKLASGDPVNAALVTGTGNGTLSDLITGVRTLSVNGIDGNGDGKADFASIGLSFDTATDTLSVTGTGTLYRFDTASQSWVAGGAYDPDVDSSGVRFRYLSDPADDPNDPAAFAFEFTAKGSWTDTTEVAFAPTEAGVADSRNAVNLGALQTTKLMLSGSAGNPTATFQSVYASMVTLVGNKTREVQVNMTAQQALLDQATDARDSLSGVNLDEEAANLVRYQMAYQSSAKVMSVAQTLFDTILTIAR
ncbi:flagellar hook-associated protein FlgK [Pseudothauera nasutitermitis]|uniref:Flagellar hook-associated protein 1 n=1 Tax=Pseudothauera nasutitermitis TaxID=2565930 RepID=A0A4S4AZT9_9RHOO|nr:flagellar hook-associated protein FlgK [Pseudothauera nasutitermitis]THF65720.1 flagellar hook-associated protein FlgK [Pseudothauera nasutitermitis]